MFTFDDASISILKTDMEQKEGDKSNGAIHEAKPQLSNCTMA